ncbi:MAG TPA: hypothetical protein VK826_18830 [Bacteroidia bacterium]|nr:hypothetical protein [Bacteroidia bacterium]
MHRREFIGRIAASFIVVQGMYLLKGCADPIDTGNLAKVSQKLQEKFDNLIAWLKENGWSEYLQRTAGLNLDLAKDELLAELVRKLDKLPSTEQGFEDFAGMRAIEPGLPAMSLLYHALASARVRPTHADKTQFDVAAYPEIQHLDVLENYIYALQEFTLTAAELKDNYVLAVFAYEYRPAFKTPHHIHADLVFSRTGVARIGEHEMNYDKINRNFTNAPIDKNLKPRVAVTAARYGLFLAKVIEGKDADIVERDGSVKKGEFTLLGTDRDNAEGRLNDDQRYFLQPVRKIFQDDLLIGEQALVFSEYHKAEKLYRLVADAEFKIPYAPADLDINKAPFVVESKLTSGGTPQESELIVLDQRESTVIVSSKKNPLIRPAKQNGKRLEFEVPKKRVDPDYIDNSNRYFTTFNSQDSVEDIEILTPLEKDSALKTRNENQFTHPRNTPLYLNIRYVNPDHDTVYEHVMADTEIIDSKHWTGIFEDSICDGQVAVQTEAWKADRIPAELFTSALPAFSIVTAPDFFPQVDSFDLLAYDINTQRHEGKESNFYEGGLPSLSAGRVRPNPNTVNFPEFTEEDKKQLTFTYTSVLSNTASKDFKGGDFTDPTRRDYASSSFLPDVCSFVFAPGWDVTYCADVPVDWNDDLDTRKSKSYLSTRGLGSPFPEDMKLCAAVNGMWPVASPDAARTFQGSLYSGDRNPTAVPLMDIEIGIHKSSPALKGSSPLAEEIFGWDGEQGPFLQIDPDSKDKFLVNFTELRRSDYLENLTNPQAHSFDMSRLRELNSAELVARMGALRRCIKTLPQISFKNELKDDHLVAYTRMWLVSAEKVEDWKAGAKGYGIPDELFESGRSAATTAQSGIEKQGYLYVFVDTVKEIFPDGDEDIQKAYRWDKTDTSLKRRLQTCATIYVCQVSEKAVSFCILEGKPPYGKGVAWKTVTS